MYLQMVHNIYPHTEGGQDLPAVAECLRGGQLLPVCRLLPLAGTVLCCTVLYCTVLYCAAPDPRHYWGLDQAGPGHRHHQPRPRLRYRLYRVRSEYTS